MLRVRTVKIPHHSELLHSAIRAAGHFGENLSNLPFIEPSKLNGGCFFPYGRVSNVLPTAYAARYNGTVHVSFFPNDFKPPSVMLFAHFPNRSVAEYRLDVRDGRLGELTRTKPERMVIAADQVSSYLDESNMVYSFASPYSAVMEAASVLNIDLMGRLFQPERDIWGNYTFQFEDKGCTFKVKQKKNMYVVDVLYSSPESRPFPSLRLAEHDQASIEEIFAGVRGFAPVMQDRVLIERGPEDLGDVHKVQTIRDIQDYMLALLIARGYISQGNTVSFVNHHKPIGERINDSWQKWVDHYSMFFHDGSQLFVPYEPRSVDNEGLEQKVSLSVGCRPVGGVISSPFGKRWKGEIKINDKAINVDINHDPNAPRNKQWFLKWWGGGLTVGEDTYIPRAFPREIDFETEDVTGDGAVETVSSVDELVSISPTQASCTPEGVLVGAPSRYYARPLLPEILEEADEKRRYPSFVDAVVDLPNRFLFGNEQIESFCGPNGIIPPLRHGIYFTISSTLATLVPSSLMYIVMDYMGKDAKLILALPLCMYVGQLLAERSTNRAAQTNLVTQTPFHQAKAHAFMQEEFLPVRTSYDVRSWEIFETRLRDRLQKRHGIEQGTALFNENYLKQKTKLYESIVRGDRNSFYEDVIDNILRVHDPGIRRAFERLVPIDTAAVVRHGMSLVHRLDRAGLFDPDSQSERDKLVQYVQDDLPRILTNGYAGRTSQLLDVQGKFGELAETVSTALGTVAGDPGRLGEVQAGTAGEINELERRVVANDELLKSRDWSESEDPVGVYGAFDDLGTKIEEAIRDPSRAELGEMTSQIMGNFGNCIMRSDLVNAATLGLIGTSCALAGAGIPALPLAALLGWIGFRYYQLGRINSSWIRSGSYYTFEVLMTQADQMDSVHASSFLPSYQSHVTKRSIASLLAASAIFSSAALTSKVLGDNLAPIYATLALGSVAYARRWIDFGKWRDQSLMFFGRNPVITRANKLEFSLADNRFVRSIQACFP